MFLRIPAALVPQVEDPSYSITAHNFETHAE
jgi:hypothetical protein